MTSVAADEDEPEVDIDASPPTGDGGYDLSVTVSDPPVDAGYGSGAARLEVYLDDEFLDAVDCSSSGCTIPYSRHMSAGQTLDQHELAVVAYDRAGNSKVAYSGKPYGEGKDADFHYFGYADFFGDPDGPIGSDGPIDLDEVTEGGGNVIRFPIPWCQIAVKDPTQPGVDPQDPQDWNWTGADAFFDAVALRGDLETIPVLFDAPRYARDPGEITPEESDAEHHPELAGSCGDSRISPPADNTTANPTAINDYWGRFVSEFVARYGPGGPHDGNLAAIEAWNEPNLSVYWGGADQDDFNPDESLFAKLVNEAGAESSVPVLPGGLATAEPIYKNDKAGIARDNPDVFLGNAVDGTGTKIDPGEVAGFNFHLYANREHNTREAEKLIRQRYKSMDDVLEGRVNYADEQRWITEIGFPSGGAFNIPFLRYATEYKQYQRMDASYRFLKGQPHVRAFLAYRLRDVRITEDPDPLVVDELVEPGRFGAIHRPADDPNGPPNHKAIYCRLAERVLGEAATEDLVCEGKKAHA
jgi:hypothetical protein